MRTRGLASLLLIASLAAAPMLVGCDHEVGRTEKTTTDSNGNQTTVQQKTVQHSDGSVTTEKDVNHVNNQ
jgi:ABC-type uncharacterized transport system auxiliary subunit